MISTHEAKRWPFTGGLSENIIDQQMNIPLLKNCNNEEFNLFMEDCVFPALARFAPEAIIIQGGADAVCDDPLSRLGLSNYTLWNAVKRLKEMCDKIILTGGGGYNPWTVARLWAGFWLVLNDRSPFIELPSGAQRGLESLSWQRKLRPSRDLITQLYDTPPALKNTYARPLALHHSIFYWFGPFLTRLQRINSLLRGADLSLWRCPAMSSFMNTQFDKCVRGALMPAQSRIFWL